MLKTIALALVFWDRSNSVGQKELPLVINILHGSRSRHGLPQVSLVLTSTSFLELKNKIYTFPTKSPKFLHCSRFRYALAMLDLDFHLSLDFKLDLNQTFKKVSSEGQLHSTEFFTSLMSGICLDSETLR